MKGSAEHKMLFHVNSTYVTGVCVYKKMKASKRERNTFRELS
jgi:hypothetical protein